MKALLVLGLALSCSVLGAAQVEWNAPLDDCLPADLVVSAEGQSYVACQEPFGAAAVVYSYGNNGRLSGKKILQAYEKESLLPRDLLLHEEILYLSFSVQTADGTKSQLVAFNPENLQVIWQKEKPHFVGNNLVALPTGGIWWLGVNDGREADILAWRYSSEGEELAAFTFDSGRHDSLGFDRRSGAAGPDASLYIGGFSQVLRVSSKGALIWQAAFPTTAIVSRADGDLIATNLLAPQGNTVHIKSDGEILWQLDQGGSALALAPDQSIWIAGTTVADDTGSWDLRLIMLSASGQLRKLDIYDGSYQDRAVDIATDAHGHAYVLASSYVKSGWLTSADRYLILKYDSDGRRIWSHLYGIVGLPEAMHVTPQGDVYAVGHDGTILVRE